MDENYDQYFAVKTHLLPSEIEPINPEIPAVYLVRDGRDAMVSIAHHRKDIVMPGSDYYENMREAILAEGGSFFGGWSKNVDEWLQRASIVIRFEDLVKDPVAQVERLREIIKLPKGDPSKLPDFETLKKSKPKYGGKFRIKNVDFKINDFSNRFFRKGKSGGWTEEMPEEMQDLFWKYHGEVMERMGYDIIETPRFSEKEIGYATKQKLRLPISLDNKRPYRVLIEANKLFEPNNDGIKRYLIHILKGLQKVNHLDHHWKFDLFHTNKIVPLSKYYGVLQGFSNNQKKSEVIIHNIRQAEWYERILLNLKGFIRETLPGRIYNPLSNIYNKINIRVLLRAVIMSLKAVNNHMSMYRSNLELKRKLESYDLIHIPLPQNYEPFRKVNNKFVVTIHDLTTKLYPDYHRPENIAQEKHGMKFIHSKNADVIGISKNTITDCEQEYNIPSKKTHLVYEAADHHNFRRNFDQNLAEKIREKYNLTNNPYFLCLSTIEPRKNLPNTIRAFNQLKIEHPDISMNLVIAGKYGWKTEHMSQDLELDRDDIIFTGFIEDNDLFVLYSEALALCYVSHYEGFGLPPMEAMSCKTPVIYGDNSSMTEIIAGNGLPANSHDAGDIKKQMSRIFFDKKLRLTLAKKGFHRSLQFTWKRSVLNTLEAYKKIIHISSSFNFFDKICFINLEERVDRLKQVKDEFERIGITKLVERFPAIKLEDGKRACKLSHIACIEKAFNEGHENVLVFEDDVEFLVSSFGHLTAALESLEKIPDWEIFYLGGRPVVPAKFVSKNLIKCKFWGNQSYVIHRRAWHYLKPLKESPKHKDVWFADNVSESYGIYPAITTQRPGFSDILKREINRKTRVFKEHYEKFVDPRPIPRAYKALIFKLGLIGR